jgi:predicted HAD superfamily Cof-like phosphohydrolase
MEFIAGVLKFNKAAGRTDDVFDPRAVALHTGFQLEELAEKLAAIGASDPSDALKYLAARMQTRGRELKRGDYDDAVAAADRHELLDGDVDLMVVSVGSMMSQGADVQGACGEVNRANLAKILPDGSVLKDANGKIQKPAGWTAPDLHPFMLAITPEA